MKALAVEGSGLNTYINKYTKFKFESHYNKDLNPLK
jgi:hypothetical protein